VRGFSQRENDMCRTLLERSRIVVPCIKKEELVITDFSKNKGWLTMTPVKSLPKVPALLRLKE
jgi:hypothetical protein